MSDQTAAGAVPPIEPAPLVSPVVAVPPPPTVDPYAPPVYTPPPPVDYSASGYGPGAYPPAYQAGYYAPQPPRGLAIASMVTGIVGVFFSLIEGFGFLPSLAAVITGHIARKRQPYARGMWLTGLICGYIGLGISLLWIVGIIFFIVFVSANPGYFDTGNLGTNS